MATSARSARATLQPGEDLAMTSPSPSPTPSGTSPAEENKPSGSQNECIDIYCRFRPSKHAAKQLCEIDKSQGKVEIRLPKDDSGYVNNQRETHEFQFNGVFDMSASQEEVFDKLARPIVMSVLDGFNGTVFAYGQTGSGKTFSITGGADSYEQRGIIPRALALIFDVRWGCTNTSLSFCLTAYSASFIRLCFMLSLFYFIFYFL